MGYLRWWLRTLRCGHPQVRCIHGDEIIARGYRRRACVRCGRALRGALPRICSVTGKPHPSTLVR